MSEPRTRSGQRLMQAMSTVPPQGRTGLLHFVLAIEAEALPSVERLAAEVDRHWMESSIAQGFVRCSCGQWRVDIPGHFDVPSLGQHFRPFSAHVAAAILAALRDEP